jgi:hypothetical protein
LPAAAAGGLHRSLPARSLGTRHQQLMQQNYFGNSLNDAMRRSISLSADRRQPVIAFLGVVESHRISSFCAEGLDRSLCLAVGA